MSDSDDILLKPYQRKYLKGETNHQQNYQQRIRQAIRNQIEPVIPDFSIIFAHLERRDREQIMNAIPDLDPRSAEEWPEDTDAWKENQIQYHAQQSQDIKTGLLHMVSFALLCMDDIGVRPESFLELSLERYLLKKQEETPLLNLEEVDVSVDVEWSFTDISEMDDEVRNELKEKTQISTPVLQEMIDNEDISTEEIQSLL